MTQITVTQQAGGTFRVQTPAGTSHQVSVPAGFAASLGCGHVAPGELIRASFDFPRRVHSRPGHLDDHPLGSSRDWSSRIGRAAESWTRAISAGQSRAAPCVRTC